MRKEELINGNILIADFLEWEQINMSDSELAIPVYKIPDKFIPNTKYNVITVEEFMFDSDWCWFMYCWDILHRQVLVPISKNNPHLRRELYDQINDMRSCLKWAHIEGAYKVLVKLITWYNDQFK